MRDLLGPVCGICLGRYADLLEMLLPFADFFNVRCTSFLKSHLTVVDKVF
jgi:hypothetical protein